MSHDRYFLDGCVDHILSFNRTNIEVQSGNFSSWMDNFNRQQEFELTQNERLQKDMKRLQQAARRSAIWSDRVEASKIGAADKGYVGHKAAKMMKRSKTFDKRQQQAIEQKANLLKNVEKVERLKIASLTYNAETLVSFSNVTISYDGKAISQPLSFTIQRGEQVVLQGKNGSGKSSLLKLLVGEQIEHTGTMTIGASIVMSYVQQDISFLKGTLSQFAKENQIDDSLLKTILRKMGFERLQFEKDMQDFF